MNKKICVVTGATSGLGLETAKLMAENGFFVVLACRNEEKAKSLCSEINKSYDIKKSCCIALDLSSFSSIENFAESFAKSFSHLDVLINNAGIICDRHHKTEQGFEMTMGVNYLGLYHLTELLLPVISKTPNARIVNVSSIVGINCNMQDEILDFHNIDHGLHAYTASKLAVILYTSDLSQRMKDKGITVNAMHPGVFGSNIMSGDGLLMRSAKPLMKLFFRPPRRHAKNLLYLATSPDVKDISGSMFMKSKHVGLKNSAADENLKKKLMQVTKQSVKEKTECKKDIAI